MSAPDTPDTPDTPDAPDSPDKPDTNPEIPDTPDKPDIKPEIPDTPDKKPEIEPPPDKPEIPADPQQPDQKPSTPIKASDPTPDARRLTPPAPSEPDWWDHSAAWLAERGALPVLALLTIAIGILHFHVFWGEPIGDDLSFHFAESVRLSDCLRAGDFDFWNPSANGGYASMYYYQAIPQLASAIPAAIFGHHLFWFQLSVFLPHVLAPAAAYRGMRLMGATPWQALLAAFAVAFMNGESRWGAGNAGTFQVGLYTQTWALCAFPLALGHAVRWIRDREGLASAIAWGAFVGLCHPFAVIVMGIGLFVGVVWRLVPRLPEVTWQSIAGRALVIVGLAELVVLPRTWARFDYHAMQIPTYSLIAAFGAIVVAGGLLYAFAGAAGRIAGRILVGFGALGSAMASYAATEGPLPAIVPLIVGCILVAAGAVPRIDDRDAASLGGRAAALLGLLILIALPGTWLYRDSFGHLPDWAGPVAGVLLLVGGILLPIVVRPANASWELPELGDWRALAYVVPTLLPIGLAITGVWGGLAGLVLAILAYVAIVWRIPRIRALVLEEQSFAAELARTLIVGELMVLAWLPVWLPLLADYNGFGGFPARVWDEVGPGFDTLAQWYRRGMILDYAPADHDRFAVLTYALPVVLLLVRSKMMRWLWPSAALYALLLGLGPKLGKIGDDLFPAVRALGAMQTVLALGIGIGALMIGRRAWLAEPESRDGKIVRTVLGVLTIGVLVGAIVFAGRSPWIARLDAELAKHLWSPGEHALRIILIVPIVILGGLIAVEILPLWRALGTQYGVRTGLSAVAAALVVLVAIPGYNALRVRVVVLADFQNNRRDEMFKINDMLAAQPPGRKQTGPGAENHWWNLLSFAYQRVPSLLQMGGGGLQASPNYDFLWWTTNQYHDYLKNAWVYDAPYVLGQKSMMSRVPNGELVAQTDNYEIRKLPAPGLVSPVQVVHELDPGSHVDTLAKAWAHVYVNAVGYLPPGYHSHQLGREAALEWIRGNQPMHDQVIAYQGSEGLDTPPHGDLVRAWHQMSPGDEPDIVAELDVRAPTTFLVHESWHPRWHAYLDGEDVAIRRVTPDFPAVDVPAGHHTLALRFERPWWALGSWLAWPLVPLVAWFAMRRRRLRKSPA